MQKAAKRPLTLAPVEEARGYGAHLPTHQAMDQRADEHAVRVVIRRERASAYWFAAAKWGMSGLFIGMILGAAMMYTATFSALPIAQDAMARGRAIEAAANALSGTPNGEQPQR
jgi:hypothetical protein